MQGSGGEQRAHMSVLTCHPFVYHASETMSHFVADAVAAAHWDDSADLVLWSLPYFLGFIGCRGAYSLKMILCK